MSGSRRRRTRRFNNRLRVAGALGVCLAAAVTSASAYSLLGSSWLSPTIPMRVQLGASESVLADGSTSYSAAAENALALWNEQMANTQFTWTEADPGAPVAFGDRVNSMQFDSKVYGDKFGSSVLAVTLTDNSGNSTQETDVIFNTATQFNSYRGTAYAAGVVGIDFHRVALHELGHVIGLDHPDEHGQTVDAIMNANVSELSFLQSDDVAGAAFLYGAPPNAPSPTGNAKTVQLSTRGSVGTGDNVMIGGFIIQGGTTKKVIIRAIGPSLGASGIAGALADPILELHDATGALIQANDNWRDTQVQEIIDTNLAPTNERESAIVAELPPGPYTAIVAGAAGGTGVALVEIYDLAPDNGKLANISTRAHLAPGDEALIGGFIISGPQSKKNVIRALGPSLGANGVAGALANPTLELYNANGELLSANDDHFTDHSQVTISSYGLSPPNTYESALYIEAAPGNFTAIVRGAGSTSGVGLIEVYGLD